MSTELSTLTTAADRWEGMAAEFAKREKAYQRDVHGISMGNTWQGLSAQVANMRFNVTLKQFQYAQTEAKAIASLLRDAHAQFVELRGRLKAACQEAIEAGMKVSEQGIVSFDTEKMTEAERRAMVHDPGFMDAVHSWQDRINTAVKNVADADAGVQIALQAVVIDSDIIAEGKGFNGQAKSDVEEYEAEKADEILTKISKGEHVSAKDLAELKRTLRDNSDDRAYAQTLLDGLGAKGTIKTTNELNDLIHFRSNGDPTGAYAAIETGLANTLATATKDTKSDWYKEWRADMQKAGVESYSTDAQGARLDKAVGYQSLVTLMRKGHGYAPDVLEDLADDMIKAEKSQPDIWQLKHEYSGKDGGWFANDPVDGVLGLMSHDPDTAARYLSSDDNMKYLMKERDWEVTVHEHQGPTASHYSPGLDGDDRVGFGAALQAAATGIDPSDDKAHYVEHSQQNTKVFKSCIEYLADSGDAYPASLREPMANILVNHGESVHAAMSEVDMDKASLDQAQLFEVAKQLSKDKDAYGILNGGLNQAMVADLHEGDSGSTESLIRSGRTIGFLEEARAQAQDDPKVAAFEAQPAIGKGLSYIPVVGGDVQEGFDYVVGKWLEDEQKKIDEKAADEKIASYENRNGQLTALAEEWRKVHGSGGEPDYVTQDLAEKSAEAGIDRARGVSGKAGQ